MTGVDPDIWYSVLIYNVTDETAVSVPYPNCTNMSETFCVFTPDHLSPCHKYNVTVIPQNGAGVGETSHILTGAPGIGNNVCTQKHIILYCMTGHEQKIPFPGRYEMYRLALYSVYCVAVSVVCHIILYKITT